MTREGNGFILRTADGKSNANGDVANFAKSSSPPRHLTCAAWGRFAFLLLFRSLPPPASAPP